MSRLLLLGSLRHIARHPWQSWLAFLGVAVGVAVILAVDLANESARQAFLLSAERLSGKATHQVRGGPAGIPEAFYTRLRLDLGVRRAAPVVEGLVEHRGERLRLVGVDPLAEGPFREFGAGLGRDATRRLMVEPGAALLSGVTAGRLGLSPGAGLDVAAPRGSARLTLVALLEGGSPALEGVVLVDISTAQELLDRPGRLDRVDLILEPGQVDRLEVSLPGGLRLEVPETRTRVMGEMIDAFQTNLRAMSLLALMVGAFLIYNTMTFSVLRRRRLLGTLRVIGVTRGKLFGLLAAEGLLLGLAGTLAGSLLGVLVARLLVQLVTRTINDLYFVLTVTQLLVDPWTLAKGAFAGLCVTLLAVALPVAEAVRSPPVEALRRSRLETRLRRGFPWLAAAGCLGLAVGWLLVLPGAGGLLTAFTGLFLIIGGYSLLTPIAVAGVTRLAGRLAARRLLPRLALRGIEANMSRTGPAIAALCVAVAATLGVGIMIASFRATVEDWIGYTLRADIYVSAAEGGAGLLPSNARSLVESLEAVAETSGGRRVLVNSEHGEVELLALDMAAASFKGFRFDGPTVEGLWPGFARGELLLVSEPFAYRHGLEAGDNLRLETAAGPREVAVGGVFYDYGSDRGLVTLSRDAYRALWGDDSLSTLGVYLRPGADAAEASAALRKVLGGPAAGLRIRSNREIRDHSMAVFDRTFTITRVLRLLAVGVAFIGVLSALMALQLEHGRERAVLRASGMTPAQVARLTLVQAGVMGFHAGLLALPLGWLMSQVLIDVINRRAFGWTILPQLPPGALLETLLLALVAALLAGLYPAWRSARARLALALREE